MGAIPIGLIFKMFALTQISGFLFLNFENKRFELGSAVRTIAKRLRFRMATSAPGINFPASNSTEIGVLAAT
jgi:hypothetical protein